MDPLKTPNHLKNKAAACCQLVHKGHISYAGAGTWAEGVARGRVSLTPGCGQDTWPPRHAGASGHHGMRAGRVSKNSTLFTYKKASLTPATTAPPRHAGARWEAAPCERPIKIQNQKNSPTRQTPTVREYSSRSRDCSCCSCARMPATPSMPLPASPAGCSRHATPLGFWDFFLSRFW